jgi:uncharacterized lipoprotein YmbA
MAEHTIRKVTMMKKSVGKNATAYKAVLGWMVLACSVFLFLPGCGKSKPSRFYVLSPLPPGNVAPPQELAIGIGPLKFPDYLLRPQIATQEKANQLKYAEYDRWAESLDDNFARILAGNLSQLIPTDKVHIYPWLEIMRVQYQLLVEVTRFGQTEDGSIVLTVYWSVLDHAKRVDLLQRRSRFSRPAPAASPPDYAALAAGMSELVGEFSREVAQALRDLQQ